ncbi:MAG: ExbD/TolR family protein [Rhodothermia bacterium]
MSVHFKKKATAKQEIPTASLPDIIFMLLIFFMVTTVLREVTIQVQTKLPKAESVQKIEQKRLVSYVYAGPIKTGADAGTVAIQIDDALVELTTIRLVMYQKLIEQPRLIVSLRVDEVAEMGLVTDIQQELRQAGTYRINYSTKRQLPG